MSKNEEVTELTFTCSNSTKETLEKGVKYVQISLQKHQNDVIDAFPLFLLLTLNIFLSFFCSISISYFEQVIVSWDGNRKIMYSTCSSE